MKGVAFHIRIGVMCAAAAVATLLGGCRTSSYDYLESWLIREDAIRSFSVPVDVFYVQGDLYTHVSHVPMMYSYATSEVGGKRFRGFGRVFSPLIETEADLEESLKWYFANHHDRGRSFVFIGEGVGGGMLKEYEQKHKVALRSMGLVASFYTDGARKGFVNDDMVNKIKDAATRARYRSTWGREMPSGMLEK